MTMTICELNNQRGYNGASNHHVDCDSWEEVERVLRDKFPGRDVAGDTAQERVAALKAHLDRTCAVTFHVIG